MDFRIGKLEEVDLGELMRAHSTEVGLLEPGRFAPNMAIYRELEKLGMLRLFLAEVDGKVVGYQAFLLTHHPHYSGVVWAQADAVYVAPEHRGVGAVRFLQWADAELMDEGVEVIQRGVSVRKDFGHLLEWMDYEVGEVTYFKRVR